MHIRYFFRFLSFSFMLLVSLNLFAETIFEESFTTTKNQLISDGWTLWSCTNIVDNSLEVVNNSNNSIFPYCYIPVEPGKKYSIRCRIKTSLIPPLEYKRGATIFAECCDENKSYVPGGTYPAGFTETDGKWSYFEIPFTKAIPSNARYFKLMLGIEGKGIAWFKDLKVVDTSVFYESFNTTKNDLLSRGWVLWSATNIENIDGVDCLEVENLNNATMLPYYYVKVSPGVKYQIQCKIKTQNVTANSSERGATVFVECVDKNKVYVPGGTYVCGVNGTSNGWIDFSIPETNQIPENACYYKVMVGLEGKGTAYFKDLLIDQKTYYAESFNTTKNDLQINKGWIFNLYGGAVDIHSAAAESADCLSANSSTQTNHSIFSYNYLKIDPGKRYVISCQVKKGPSANSYTNNTFRLLAECVDNFKIYTPGGVYPDAVDLQDSWTEYSIPITYIVPEYAHYYKLCAITEGSVLIKNLVIKEYQPSTSVGLVLPANNQMLDHTRPVFKWTLPQINDGKEHRYQFVIAADSQLTSSRKVYSTGTKTEFRLPEFLPINSTWYWQIQEVTKDSSLTEINNSEIRTVKIHNSAADLPSIFDLIYPVFGPQSTIDEKKRPTFEAEVEGSIASNINITIDGQGVVNQAVNGNIISFKPSHDLLEPDPNNPGEYLGSLHKIVFKTTVNGEEVSQTEYYSNIESPNKITFVNRIAKVNGNPVFPIGAYLDPSDTWNVTSNLALGNFNLSHTYRFEGPCLNDADETSLLQDLDTYLQNASSNNLMIFLGLPRNWVKDKASDKIAKYVSKAIGSNALFCWYLMDEPTVNKVSVDEMANAYNTISKIDKNHPCLTAYANIVTIKSALSCDYAKYTDILGCDPYPLYRGKTDFSSVYSWMKSSRDIVGNDKPVWCVVSAMDPFYKTTGIVVHPTEAELTCECFLALAGGADGILFYWYSLKSGGYTILEPHADHVWDNIKNVVNRLRLIESYMTTPESLTTATIALNSQSPVKYWIRTNYQGKTIVAIINPKDSSESCIITSLTNNKNLYPENGGSVIGVNSMISLSPYEVKFYELK